MACESAAARAPENGAIVDSRGLALALTGDFAAAIEDFDFLIDWAESDSSQEEAVELRHFFIAELQAGRNPFTDEAVLEQLRNE